VEWIVFCLLFDMLAFDHLISNKEGKMVSHEAFYLYKVFQMQVFTVLHFRNNNVLPYYQYHLLLVLSLVASAMSFDEDGIEGLIQMIACP